VTINKSVNFKVNGMTCGGCANKVKNGLEGLKIEHTVNIDLPTGKVNVKFNSEESTVAALKSTITNAGFQVESIELE